MRIGSEQVCKLLHLTLTVVVAVASLSSSLYCGLSSSSAFAACCIVGSSSLLRVTEHYVQQPNSCVSVWRHSALLFPHNIYLLLTAHGLDDATTTAANGSRVLDMLMYKYRRFWCMNRIYIIYLYHTRYKHSALATESRMCICVVLTATDI